MHCSLEDTPTTRSATRSKLGPWYVLQSRNPSAPGMNFATLMVLVQKGRVTARSVLRGPTTGQFWRHAAKVKGVSREFGLCWNCGGDIGRNARACPGCKRLQEPPLNPDVLLESGEFSGEELAEAMWSDVAPTSSQMPGPASAPPPPRSASVDRLVSRGGVRREVPPQPQPQPQLQPHAHSDSGIGSLPARPHRGVLADGASELPANEMEMAVFQRPYHPSAPAGGARRAWRGVLKVMLVAVLLSAAGVVAMCSFDEAFRKRVVEFVDTNYQKVKRTWSGGGGAAGGPSSPSSSAPPAVTSEQTKETVARLWKEGIDADKRADFPGAVRAWEAIKALPVAEDDLPLGLDARLAAARKRL
jgi:hypothetical protein